MSVNAVEKHMRENTHPIIGRIEEDYFIMDLRTIKNDELAIIENALSKIPKKGS
jgi:L-seryl-tRNA(Ser) seleniumtransferase